MSNAARIETSDGIPNSSSSGLLELKRERMQCFLQWFAGHGAVFPFVKMEVEENSRTLRANTRIGKGVLIMHIPRSLMITEEMVKASRIGKMIASQTEGMSLSGYFSAFLLEAKRTSNFWKLYIDVLPDDFSTHPLFFSDAELEELQGTYALRIIREELKSSSNEYKMLQKFLPAEMRFTLGEYLWAKCAIMSRLHHVVIGQQNTRALVPLADMPDHDANANVRWEYEASQGFIYTAKREIEEGEVLTIDYRTTNNSSSFRIFGFCPAGEVNNQTEIHLPSMPSSHPFYEYAKNLGLLRAGKRSFRVSANHNKANARAMFSYLRLYPLQDLSGMGRNKARESDKGEIDFVSLSNEMDALSMLAMACDEQLECFPTSIEEDEALLQLDDLPINASNAVRVRLGEKKVLHYFQNFSRIFLFSNTKSGVRTADEPEQPIKEMGGQ
jgi:hypothetical protein